MSISSSPVPSCPWSNPSCLLWLGGSKYEPHVHASNLPGRNAVSSLRPNAFVQSSYFGANTIRTIYLSRRVQPTPLSRCTDVPDSAYMGQRQHLQAGMVLAF
jgi:hypothetical protein